MDNGTQVRAVTTLALAAPASVDWFGYRQRQGENGLGSPRSERGYPSWQMSHSCTGLELRSGAPYARRP
jgi:hypothetical protein